MKRMRAEDRNEIYRPLDSKLKFGYFTQCYKGRNIDHDYINEFYNNPFSINYSYGLVKAENVYQLTKEKSNNEETKLPQRETPVNNLVNEDVQDKLDTKVSNLEQQVLELYFVIKQKPKVIARKLKISKHRIYRIVEGTKKCLI